jgi:hypothetical protein
MRTITLETEKTDNQPQRLFALLEYLRLRLGDDASIDQVVTKLNLALAKGKKLSRQSLRCWYYQERTISKSNKMRLAKALDIRFEDLELYLSGQQESDQFFSRLVKDPLQGSEANIINQVMRLIQQLSPAGVAEVLAKGSEMLHGYLERMFQPQQTSNKTIAQLVSEKIPECVDLFDGIVPNAERRVHAIANGDYPTDMELELLASVLCVELGILRKIRKETFGNGNGINHQGSNRDR